MFAFLFRPNRKLTEATRPNDSRRSDYCRAKVIPFTAKSVPTLSTDRRDTRWPVRVGARICIEWLDSEAFACPPVNEQIYIFINLNAQLALLGSRDAVRTDAGRMRCSPAVI